MLETGDCRVVSTDFPWHCCFVVCGYARGHSVNKKCKVPIWTKPLKEILVELIVKDGDDDKRDIEGQLSSPEEALKGRDSYYVDGLTIVTVL